jgi:hypothetical protein
VSGVFSFQHVGSVRPGILWARQILLSGVKRKRVRAQVPISEDGFSGGASRIGPPVNQPS